jgi:hypothetical protein
MGKKIVLSVIFLFICIDCFGQAEDRSGPVAVIVTEGGLCQYGPCRAEFKVNTDGTYVSWQGPEIKAKGRLDQQEFDSLKALIAGTDFNPLQKDVFTGTCPSAYDGPKYHYSFYLGLKVEELDSCQQRINYSLPLFKALETILHKASEN